MSMWEIDELLKGSISLVKESNLSEDEKRHVTWNLENLPEKFEMDAGGFSKTENDERSLYDEMPPFKLGEIISIVATEQNKTDYIYDWSAFLLNYSTEYFIENLKKATLLQVKELYHNQEFSGYAPKHPTLTIYKDGNKYFSDEQNELIEWFLN